MLSTLPRALRPCTLDCRSCYLFGIGFRNSWHGLKERRIRKIRLVIERTPLAYESYSYQNVETVPLYLKITPANHSCYDRSCPARLCAMLQESIVARHADPTALHPSACMGNMELATPAPPHTLFGAVLLASTYSGRTCFGHRA